MAGARPPRCCPPTGYRLAEAPARLGGLVPVPDHQRGYRDALWNRLRRDGYLFLPAQLDAELVTEFRRHYFSALAGSGLADDPDGHDSGSRLIDAPLLRKVLFGDIVPGTAYRDSAPNRLSADGSNGSTTTVSFRTSARSCGTFGLARRASGLPPRPTMTWSICGRAPTGCCLPGYRSATARSNVAR